MNITTIHYSQRVDIRKTRKDYVSLNSIQLFYRNCLDRVSISKLFVFIIHKYYMLSSHICITDEVITYVVKVILIQVERKIKVFNEKKVK